MSDLSILPPPNIGKIAWPQEITLRDYQHSAVAAATQAINERRNEIVVLPTGSGKSYVLATLALQHEGRVLIISHRKELLEQNQAAIVAMDPDANTGIYSAGLGKRDTDSRILLCGVQSIYRKTDVLQKAGAFSLVMVDECHLISRRSESMYGKILERLPGVALIGLTATPYRMDSGQLHQGPLALFNDIAIHIRAKELTPEYLSPIVGAETVKEILTESVHVRGGEFVAKELDQVASDEQLIDSACKEAVKMAGSRKTWIVFCCGVMHATLVSERLKELGISNALITGETNAKTRSMALAHLKKEKIQALVNVDVATTGFDIPNIDTIVSLRPTLSKGLWVQQVGRGMRKAPHKTDCIVLDFGGNCKRHGDLDIFSDYIVNPESEKAKAKKAAADARKIARHGANAWDGSIDGGARELPVYYARYFTAPSRKHEGKRNLVVEYQCENGERVRQWVCLEYPGGAGWHAKMWFARRGIVNPPKSAAQAMKTARTLPSPSSLSVVENGRFLNIQLEHWEDEIEESID